MNQIWSLDDYLIYVGGISGTTKSDNDKAESTRRICVSSCDIHGSGNTGKQGFGPESHFHSEQEGSRGSGKEGFVNPCCNAGRILYDGGTN